MRKQSPTRRQFLRRVGGTLAAGVGIALVPAGLAHASPSAKAGKEAATPDHDQQGRPIAHPDACSIQCILVTCGAPSGCPSGQSIYHCTGCGENFTQCLTDPPGGCATFCDCMNCC